MKNLFLKFSLVIAVVFTLVSCDKDEKVGADALPVAASTFIKEYFPTATILFTEKETELGGYEFDVVLSNGVEISFDENGTWKSVEARIDANALPNTDFILPAIVDYVTTNHKSVFINGIEKEQNGFDVELTNGLDLVFDKDGKFVRID